MAVAAPCLPAGVRSGQRAGARPGRRGTARRYPGGAPDGPDILAVLPSQRRGHRGAAPRPTASPRPSAGRWVFVKAPPGVKPGTEVMASARSAFAGRTAWRSSSCAEPGSRAVRPTRPGPGLLFFRLLEGAVEVGPSPTARSSRSRPDVARWRRSGRRWSSSSAHGQHQPSLTVAPSE